MRVGDEALRDEIILRRASIADARGEFASGELTTEQLERLVAHEESAIAHCEQRLAASETDAAATVVPDVPARSRSSRRHRRSYLVTALACFTVAVVAALISTVVLRQPGNSETGSIGGSTAQQVTRLLAQGEIDQAERNPAAALAAFNDALALDPNNVEALAQSGWIYFSAGSAASNVSLISQGEGRVRQAVLLGPSSAGPRLYYSIIAASTPGQRALAVRQLRIFLRLKPSLILLDTARPWLQKYDLPLR